MNIASANNSIVPFVVEPVRVSMLDGGTHIRFDRFERESIEEFAQSHRPPRVFVLMLQLAYRTIQLGDDRVRWVPSTELANRMLWRGNGFKAQLDEALAVVCGLPLLLRKEMVVDGVEREVLLTLTHEGKRFVMNGIKSRLSMRKFARLNDDQICDQIAVDEVDEWRQESLDRGAVVSELSMLASGTEVDGSRAPTVGVTRLQYADTIASHTIQQIKAAQATVNPLWAGLIR